MTNRERRIREIAYHLREQEGRPEGPGGREPLAPALARRRGAIRGGEHRTRRMGGFSVAVTAPLVAVTFTVTSM